MLKKKPSVSIFCGPTASGKSGGAVGAAKKVGGEIINCDLSQIYTVGKIATAQISEEDMQGVPHHLIGFIDEPKSLSVYSMRERIEKKILDIFAARGEIPIFIVGGSVFCVYSLFFAPVDYYTSMANFYSSLSFFDSDYCFSKFDSFSQSLKKGSEREVYFSPLFDYRIIHFDVLSQIEWRCRVKERFLSFLKTGLLEEIASMESIWKEFFLIKKTIGYFQILSFMKKTGSNCFSNLLLPDSLVDEVFYKTCQYGKRQRTYGRKLFRDTAAFSVFNSQYLIS